MTLLEQGALRVFAAATHGVFSGQAYENIASTPFEQIVVTDTIPLRPGAPDNVRRAALRRAPDRLDPPDLHRRLGERGLRRREPALLSSPLAALASGLGLSDDEALAIFQLDALAASLAVSTSTGRRSRSSTA